MKNLPLITLIFLLLIACSTKSTSSETSSSINSDQFIGEWYGLMETDSALVILLPCDSEPLSVSITKEELRISYGHDFVAIKIQQFEVAEKSLTIKGASLYNDNAPLEEHKFTFYKQDQLPYLSYNETFYGKNSDYKSVDEPCHECWDDCE